MTPKQEQFARLYVETGNASEAYRQAYNTDNMKPETVTNEAYKLLQAPDISAMVDNLKAEAEIQEKPKSYVSSIAESLTEEEKKAILDLALKTHRGKWEAVTLADIAAVTGKDTDKTCYAVILITALDRI